ncbi:protein-lysine N-methyltransferase SMYD4 [Nomia melanderi]|uniref:protein-lysine N-methyltransferase SMYD4 n=1 Tax=Nomia melanderi TaxID=2448451 RepID=UPI003FCDD02B
MKWHNVLEELTSNLTKMHAFKEKVKHEHELMSLLWSDESSRKLVSLWLKHCYNKKESKSIALARNFKEKGNKQFQAKNYSKSIEFYTKCALYAPAKSSELPVAIANRSASLFYLNRYHDCIKDIELAIQFKCPKEIHYKLHLRLVKCYLKLGKPDLAKEMISKIRTLINNPDYVTSSMKDDVEKQISEIKFNVSIIQEEKKNVYSLLDLKSKLMFDENPNFPYASVSIDRRYNEELGRHVIANRFIRKGEILFLEKPVSFVVLNHDTMDHFCQNCNYSDTDVLVPCTECLITFYCNANCLNEAWSSYHRWECPGSQMNLWREIGIGHLALKVLLTCVTTTDTIKFNEIQNLITNFNKLPIEDLIVYGITAMMLTTYLLEYTDFFERNNLNDHLANKFSDNSFNSNFDIITENNKHLYISSLLLKYILQLICNGHAVSKSDILLNKDNFYMDQQDIIATGIYPSASIMNHSCDPNILNIFMDQYLIVRALRDIATNEEVFNCYGPHYRHMSREERQQILSSQYHFICKCKPCTQPDLQYFLERFSALNCLKCTGALCNIKNSLFCVDCFDKPITYQQNKIKQADALFQAAEECIDQEKLEEALNKFKKCLHIRKTVLYKYNENIVFVLNAIAELYITKGQLTCAIGCVENTIAAVAERFGSFSTELLTTLIKLTDLCVMYLQKESDTTTSTYKTLFRTTYKYLDQVEELADFNYGSWNKIYEDIKGKRNKMISII